MNWSEKVKMMQPTPEEKVREVVGPLWMLLNESRWPANPGNFSTARNAAASVLAHVAYCAIGDEERERVERAKVIPCEVFEKLIYSDRFDFVDLMSSVDFQDVKVVRTKMSVAVLVPARNFILVAVRGTMFAYEWCINLNVMKAHSSFGGYVHRGFLAEAERLASAIRDCLNGELASRISSSKCAIYLSGHSLGGAVSVLLSQMQFPVPINECYVFGSPRVGKRFALKGQSNLFATRQPLDIVPRCPPCALGFDDYTNQFTCDSRRLAREDEGELMTFAYWLRNLKLKKFQMHHSIENYRFEVVCEAKRDLVISEQWRVEWPDFKPSM